MLLPAQGTEPALSRGETAPRQLLLMHVGPTQPFSRAGRRGERRPTGATASQALEERVLGAPATLRVAGGAVLGGTKEAGTQLTDLARDGTRRPWSFNVLLMKGAAEANAGLGMRARGGRSLRAGRRGPRGEVARRGVYTEAERPACLGWAPMWPLEAGPALKGGRQ